VQYVVLVCWLVVGLVWPSGPARLVPRPLVHSIAAAWLVVGSLSVVWLAIGWGAGEALVTPGPDGGDPTGLGIAFALVLGGPAVLVTIRVWRAAERLARRGRQRPWTLPPLAAVTLAPDVRDRTPLPRGPQLGPWEAHRTDRGLRRTRAALVALIILLVWVLRTARLFDHTDTDPGAPVSAGDETWLLAMGVLAVATVLLLLVRGVISHRHRRGARPLSVTTAVTMNGWLLSAEDDADLVRAFPTSPLLRVTKRGERVRQELTVHATSGARHWWAVQQHARVERRSNQLATPDTRASWLVWLPGVRLAPVLVTGRDNVRVRDWFTGSVRLESELFNQRLYVYTIRGAERAAVDVVHPRMMELLLRCLPDGATLLVQDDFVYVWRDGPMHGTDLCTHASLALQVADLLPGFLLADALTPMARGVRARGTGHAGSSVDRRSDQAPAVVTVRWLTARAFQSDDEALRRVSAADGSGGRDGADVLVDFLYEVRCTVGEWLSANAGSRPLRLLVSVGLHRHGAPGFWCESVPGEGTGVLSGAELDGLVARLRAVDAQVRVDADPVAFALAVAVNDTTAQDDDFPSLPTPWRDAIAAAGRPLAVPDELFDWLWERDAAPVPTGT
jgi:hypothetical protein